MSFPPIDQSFVRDRTTQTTLSPLQAWRPTPQNGGIGFDASATIRYMSADASKFVFDFRSPPAVDQNFYVVNFSGGVSTLQAIAPRTSLAWRTQN